MSEPSHLSRPPIVEGRLVKAYATLALLMWASKSEAMRNERPRMPQKLRQGRPDLELISG